MTIDDLIPVGKLSRTKRSDKEYLLFKPLQNFLPEYFIDKDIFLLFKDHSVRYVTIENIREDRNIWIRIEEKDVIDEVVAAGSAMVCKPADEIGIVNSKKQRALTGMKVIFKDQHIADVCAVDNYGASDIITAVDFEGKEFMIPDVLQYIIEKDYEGMRIIVKDIQQFREL